MTGVAPKLLAIMPFLFGVGFIAPLTAELIEAFGATVPFGLTPIGAGLAFGGTWGLIANIRGRWL